MTDQPRLIEVAFPLRQTSIDSVHEKNVRHGHISTLHIWPARRPLAACRAALIATLLPDPGDAEKRKELLEKLAGRVKRVVKRKKNANGKMEETVVEETEGGILHWGRETENKETLDWFRAEIRKAYGGRAPRVLDPFAGGGAIPLEAMRLGCETTAVDINPVAWFILKCTLEYPQKLAGQKRKLPDFILNDEAFMRSFFEAHGYKNAGLRHQLEKLGLGTNAAPMMDGVAGDGMDLEADLAWHVRAWGRWVLNRARRDLAAFYPTYADFEPLQKTGAEWERREMRLVPLKEDGTPDIESLNAEFDAVYLQNKGNPRWVAKPTVAYLWARTVTCKNCRATIPLLKTRWLCKKDKKRVVLTMEPNIDRTGVVFGVQTDVPVVGGNAAQQRAYDKQVSAGTMSRSGARCPCCNVIMTMGDIRIEGQAGLLGAVMTSVVVEGQNRKEYFAPTDLDVRAAMISEADVQKALALLGKIELNTPMKPASTRSISCHLYGVKNYEDLFTHRQIIALCSLAHNIHLVAEQLKQNNYSAHWLEPILGYLSLGFDRLLSFTCVNVRWKVDAEAVVDAFSRFSISLLWDFAEPQPIGDSAGSWLLCFERIATALQTYRQFGFQDERIKVFCGSADELEIEEKQDVIITDPPYYQAISYADLSDFFYVWLRGTYPLRQAEFDPILTPKDQEIVQHIREDKNRQTEKNKYEQGMLDAFSRSYAALSDNGRFVCVFAHKDPDAWETLVSSIIRAGFVVTGSLPIQTEMLSRQRASETAALSSSVWLVCKKRPETARAGWDNRVLEDMQERIALRLRDFWDAGLRGPDFIWAATGPALEAYSKHPIVKKANDPGKVMTVAEFLRHVRRIVVDFVVGRVLTHNAEDEQAATGLDDVTTYYLLHRHDFRMTDAPIGACILYAVSCNLSDAALADTYDILARTGGTSASIAEDIADEEMEDAEDMDGADEASTTEGTGSRVRLKDWRQRKRPQMGFEAPGGRSVPLIDCVHRLMHFWRAGDVIKVDDYTDARGLRQNNLFHQLLQALIELAPHASEERSLLESISNHVAARGVRPEKKQMELTAL